jgi:predicted transcriptional regulator
MTKSKQIPNFQLTPEQREIVESVRRQIEVEKPEIIAESRRMKQADEVTSVQLRGAFGLLKALRQSQHVSLAALAELTGISKPSLSRLENDPTANVTLNTLTRVADALGHDLHIAVVPKTTVKKAKPPRLSRV